MYRCRAVELHLSEIVMTKRTVKSFSLLFE
nr:MAG TPA: hypothetical protein [Caudoviricetes sp.]